MPNAWFRMYNDFLDDAKLMQLAFEDQRHFIAVLALKSLGVIDQACDSKLLDRIVAQKLWVDFSSVVEVKRRLIDAGLIDKHWQPIAWEKRQFVSDHDVSAAERQRRYREKQRHALRNVTDNALVTHADTDTDTDTETETETEKNTARERASPAVAVPEKPKRKQSVQLDFSELPQDLSHIVRDDWLEHRKRIGAPVSTQTVIRTITKELDLARAAGISPDDALSEAITQGWRGFKAEWLASKRRQPGNGRLPASTDDHRERFFAEMRAKNSNGRTIEGEVIGHDV